MATFRIKNDKFLIVDNKFAVGNGDCTCCSGGGCCPRTIEFTANGFNANSSTSHINGVVQTLTLSNDWEYDGVSCCFTGAVPITYADLENIHGAVNWDGGACSDGFWPYEVTTMVCLNTDGLADIFVQVGGSGKHVTDAVYRDAGWDYDPTPLDEHNYIDYTGPLCGDGNNMSEVWTHSITPVELALEECSDCSDCTTGTRPPTVSVTLAGVFGAMGIVDASSLNTTFVLPNLGGPPDAASNCIWQLKFHGPANEFVDAETENWAGINLGDGYWCYKVNFTLNGVGQNLTLEIGNIADNFVCSIRWILNVAVHPFNCLTDINTNLPHFNTVDFYGMDVISPTPDVAITNP